MSGPSPPDHRNPKLFRGIGSDPPCLIIPEGCDDVDDPQAMRDTAAMMAAHLRWLLPLGVVACGARSDILLDAPPRGDAGHDAGSDVDAANALDARDAQDVRDVTTDAPLDAFHERDAPVTPDAGVQDLLYLPNNVAPTATTWGWTGSGWVSLSTGNEPPPRDQTALASDGQEAVLYGGLDPNNDLQDDTWTWKNGAWTERALGTHPGPRAGHSMAQLGTTAVLFGGYMSATPFAPLADTWIFDGSSWTELSPPTSPSPRTLAAFASMGDKAVLFGGSDSGGNSLDDTWIWDGATWTQVITASSPPPSYAQTLATLGTSVVLFVPYDTSLYVTTWSFDGATWTAEPQGQTRAPSTYGFGLAANGSRVLLFGGYDEATDSPQDHTYAWDGTSWSDLGASSQVTFGASQATPCLMAPVP